MPDESLALMRHHLGAIDLSTVKENVELSESDRRDYVAAIHAVFPRIERDIKHFLYNQLLFSAKEAADWEQVIFGRGMFDGMAQLLEHWRLAHQEHQSYSIGGSFEKHAPLSEM